MARVQCEIRDPANGLTLRTILEADGHTMVDSGGDVLVTDDPETARSRARRTPTLVLAGLNEVGAAVRAMRAGAYGYILTPFQAGEAELMVRRAAASRAGAASSGEEEPASLAQVEARHIREVLRACRDNRARAARILGIGRNTLWRKLKQIEESERSE